MKFMRRPDLDAQSRIQIVMQAWLNQGVYGKMTQLAQSYQISRTFLYQLLFVANLHLEMLSRPRRRVAALEYSLCRKYTYCLMKILL